MHRVKGQRVLITRAAEDCATWASRLADMGAVPLMLPCIECHPIRDPYLAARLGAALQQTDWLVLTSRRGAEALGRLIAPIAWSQTDKAVIAAIRIAVVGPATAAAAASLPGQVELVAPSGTAQSLAKALAARLRDHTTGDSRMVRSRCLIAVAENAGNILQETLEQAGGECLRLNVYRTVPAAPGNSKQALSELGADKILLASPSAVTGMVNRLELDVAAEILTIGPSTTRAAHAAGLTVTAEAARPSLEGLMEAMQ